LRSPSTALEELTDETLDRPIVILRKSRLPAAAGFAHATAREALVAVVPSLHVTVGEVTHLGVFSNQIKDMAGPRDPPSITL
jgi:hypothetical protein